MICSILGCVVALRTLFSSVVGGKFVAVFSVTLVIIQLRGLGFPGALKVSQTRAENPLKPLAFKMGRKKTAPLETLSAPVAALLCCASFRGFQQHCSGLAVQLREEFCAG